VRKRWVQVAGQLVPAGESPPDPAAPLVMPDIQPYRSMVDGSLITSRSRHREHLRAHGVVEVGNEKFPPRKLAPPPGLKQRLIEITNQKTRRG